MSCSVLILLFGPVAFSQTAKDQVSLDQKVKHFLDNNRSQWRDLNGPYEDGQVLFDLIIKNDYKSALEIGTSTGHSTIWLAWALSKTGGKLTTIDIDQRRLEVAKENLKKSRSAGVYRCCRSPDSMTVSHQNHRLLPALLCRNG